MAISNEQTKKKIYAVTYQYKYGDPKVTKVKAESTAEAARIVEHRRFGNYVLAVNEFNPHKNLEDYY